MKNPKDESARSPAVYGRNAGQLRASQKLARLGGSCQGCDQFIKRGSKELRVRAHREAWSAWGNSGKVYVALMFLHERDVELSWRAAQAALEYNGTRYLASRNKGFELSGCELIIFDGHGALDTKWLLKLRRKWHLKRWTEITVPEQLDKVIDFIISREDYRDRIYKSEYFGCIDTYDFNSLKIADKSAPPQKFPKPTIRCNGGDALGLPYRPMPKIKGEEQSQTLTPPWEV